MRGPTCTFSANLTHFSPQAANLLQVQAVEQAAVDFLVERLDAGNVLSALALGVQLGLGRIVALYGRSSTLYQIR